MPIPPPILPLVNDYQPLPGQLPLAGGLRLDASAAALPPRAADALRGLFAALPAASPRAPVCRVGLRHDADAPAESYELLIEPARIVIEAGDEAGLLHAIGSLRQLAAAQAGAGGGGLACGRIKDAPRFAWRGFMLDSARHFQPIDWIKRHLDRMAALKLNRFHWHLCDDQAWRAEIRRYPRLTEVAAQRGGDERDRGFYTQDEMRSVVAHARRLGIAVIPEIETPGHCNAALVAYPELSCTGEPLPVAPGGGWDAFTRDAGRRPFCAGREEVHAFLRHVLEEINAVFDPPYLHIGGDETPRQPWDECDRCGALKRELGGADGAALRLHFLGRLHDFCRDELGKPTIAWTDGVSDRIPGGQVVHAWFAGEAAAAARLGYPVINSNHEWTYLDYPATRRDAQRKPAWMLVLPVEKVYCFDPLPDGLEPEFAGRVLGAEAPMWTEHAPDEDELERQIMPRLAAFAEALWSPRTTRSFDDFARRLALHDRLGTFRLAAEPVAPVAVA